MMPIYGKTHARLMTLVCTRHALTPLQPTGANTTLVFMSRSITVIAGAAQTINKITRKTSIGRLLSHMAHVLIARMNSEDTIVMTLRHVVMLFSVTVTGSTPTTAQASAGYRASVNITRAQVVLPRCQRKLNYPENVSHSCGKGTETSTSSLLVKSQS